MGLAAPERNGVKRFANRPAAVSEIGDRPGVVLAGFLSMNLKTLALILKGLRVSGSWSQCTAKMASELSMNPNSKSE